MQTIMIQILYLSICLAVFGRELVAETPFTATSKLRIYRVLDNGTRQLEKESTLKEGRDALGNRYTNQIGYGKENISLWLKSSGDLYQIDPVRKTKHLVTNLSNPPGVIDVSAPGTQAGVVRKDVYNGIPCLRLSRLSGTGETKKEVGFTCVSQELGGLTVYMESPMNVNDANFVTIIDNLEIQLGVEPPAEWFQLPTHFVDVKPKVSNANP